MSGFVGRALEDFSGGPSHAAEILNPKRPAENKFKQPKNKNLLSFFSLPTVLFGWRDGGCAGVGVDLGGDFGVGVGDLAIYKKKGSHKLHQGAAIYC